MHAHNRQPNFNADTTTPDTDDDDRGRSPTGSQAFWLLYRGGPMTSAELDAAPKVDDRRLYDVRQFDPIAIADAVWYLGQFHDPEKVLRRWFAANRERLHEREVTGRAITYALGEPFETAWKRIRDEAQYDGFTSTQMDPEADTAQDKHECPKCGEPFGNLPRHLPRCDGES